ncbi:MAG: flagellar export chaperone FliS [Gammaproteobacteria bacterium]
MNNPNQIYTDIELDTEVMTASNHRLIQMLIDKCLQHIQLAKAHIVNKDIKKKHHAISKAADIINYLRTCLNVEEQQTKELAVLLESIYNHLEKSLLQATLKNDIEYLDHAHAVLSNIKSGWDQIATPS